MIAAVAAVAAGAVAALIRFGVSRVIRSPWGVLVVNVAGSAIGGLVAGLAFQYSIGPEVQLVVLGGFCGGLTTFSTLSVETIQLVQRGKWREAMVSVGANLVLGVGAAAAGYALAFALALV